MNQQCEKYQAWLSEFVDCELDSSSCAEMEKHLEQCPACKKELAMLRLACSAVGRLQNPPAPPDFMSKLRQKIDAETLKTTPGLWQSATRWLLGHPGLAAAGLSFMFVFAFLLGRFAPTPQMAGATSEMEPMSALKSVPATKVAYNLEFKGAPEAARGEVAEAMPEPREMEREAAPSLATPVSFSALGAPPATSEAGAPVARPRIELQTPTQLIITVLRLDPLFANALIYPIREGAVVQTSSTVYRFTISDQNFINALRTISEQRRLPQSISEAETMFQLDVEKMPSPLTPSK